MRYSYGRSHMNNRELVVRIIQPAEQPHLPKAKSVPVFSEGNNCCQGKEKGKNLFQSILSGVGVAAIVALGIFFVVSFFNLGFSFREIAILVGIPLVVGLVASYVIF